MTCKITRPTPDALFNRVRDMFSTTVLGGASIIPESNEWYAVSLNYAMAEEFYSVSEQAWRERDPRFACCDNLIEMAELDGVYPRAAASAQGYVKITGVVGTVVPQTISFTFGDKEYVPAGAVASQVPSSGIVIVRAQAVEPGPGGNLPSTQTGTLVGGIPGLDAEVSVYGGRFCGGADAEQCEPFRARYLERLAVKTNYGLDWIKEQVLAWPCVTGVCERAGNCCEASVDAEGKQALCNTEIQLYALFDGTFECGLPPECVTDEMTDVIFGMPQGQGRGLAEWGMFGKIYSAKPTYIRVLIAGLDCNTPTQSAEILSRVTDYVSRVCPSETLSNKNTELTVAQVLGKSTGFSVIFQKVDPNDPNVDINFCGDAVPLCDYKVCVTEVSLLGNPAVEGVCP